MSNETTNPEPIPFPFQAPPIASGVAAQPETEKPTNGRRGKRGPRRVGSAHQVNPDAPKRGRPRVVKTDEASKLRPKKARQVKVTLEIAMEACAGLQTDDARLLIGMVQALGNVSKAARKRVIEALGRIFA